MRFVPAVSIPFLLILSILGCKPEDIVPTPRSNPDLLFPHAEPLNIRQEAGSSSVSFQVGEQEGSYLYVAVYTNRPRLVGEEVVSMEAPLWHFQGPLVENSELLLTDGEFRSGGPVLDADFFFCAKDSLYWAAWAWDETADFVVYSSRADNVLTPPTGRPKVRLQSARKVAANAADTFLNAGAEISLRLEFKNVGDAPAKTVYMALRHNDIEELPQQVILDDLAPTATTTTDITFRLPEDVVLGERMEFIIWYTYNQCIDDGEGFTLVVNGQRVLLTDIRLREIKYTPSFGWDFNPNDPSPPDPYYLFLDADNRELYRVQAERDVASGSVDWPDLTPPLMLDLESIYRVLFYDEDPNTNDELIGEMRFRPLDYLKEQPAVIEFSDSKISSEIHLKWE